MSIFIVIQSIKTVLKYLLKIDVTWKSHIKCLLIYYIWVIRYKEEIEEIRKTEENPLIGQSVEARDSTVAYWLNKLNNNK